MSLDHRIVQFIDGSLKLDVSVSPDERTVWLTQDQLASLFETTKQNISLHVTNILKENELDESTVKDSLTVQTEGNRQVMRKLKQYHLDMIISIGYRIKSNRGILFRRWATRVISDIMIEGYAIDRERLRYYRSGLESLQNSIRMLSTITKSNELDRTDVKDMLDIIHRYSYGLDTLDRFDRQSLEVKNTTSDERCIRLDYETAVQLIRQLPGFHQEGLFGREKDRSFESTINAIYQSAFGVDAYPSVEEKAAHLVYFIVKNHAFVDGNKRIAAALLLWFMNANGILFDSDQHPIIDDNALVALVLMIALSDPADKEIIVKIIINLINRDNIR